MKNHPGVKPDHVAIAMESPLDPQVVELIRQLDAYQASLYPAESNHFVSVEALAQGDVRFFVARYEGQPLGCGALRIAGAEGEIKRMFVLPLARGLRLGRRILERIEAQAREEGVVWLRLETGIHQEAALALYRAAGYCDCGPFGDYGPDPLSVFMEKFLAG